MTDLYQLFNGRFHVIQGGARGADEQAWFAAKKLNVPVETEMPDWKKDGRRAGIFRNIRMLEKPPQFAIALWDGKSRGTLHTIENTINRYRVPLLLIQS